MHLSPKDFAQLRTNRGLNQAAMGRFLGGYTSRQVRRWESGESEVPPAVETLLWVLFKVCDDALEEKLKRRNQVS